MARLRDLAISTSDMFNFDPRIIEVENNFNVRNESPELDAHIRMIADSIKAQGFLRTNPLSVVQIDDRVVLRDGHCRLRAVMLAIDEGCEIKSVPCVIIPRQFSQADQTLMLITSNNGMALSIIEKAEVVKRLVSYGWTETEIAIKIGVGEQTITKWLTLAGASTEIKTMVVEGVVAATTAIRAIETNGHKQATETLKAEAKKAKKEGRERVTGTRVSNGGRSTAQKLTDFEGALRDILGVNNLQEAKSIAESALRGLANR